MKIGPYQVDTVETGEFRLDGGAMFGVVPKVLWERKNPPDEQNRIPMALRSCLIRGNGRVILVDSGIGQKWDDRLVKMYAIDHSRFQLETSLRKLGVGLEDVTDVIISHMHFDHIGGAPEFPNAKYHIHERNLSHAHAPTEKDRASFIEHTIGPVLESGRLNRVTDDYEFAPGVSAWVTEGHTPGHIMVKVTDGKTTLLCCGDTIPTASHIAVPWVMAYDLYPMTTIEEKKKILDVAVRENWILFFVHDPFKAACTVQELSGKFSEKLPVAL